MTGMEGITSIIEMTLNASQNRGLDKLNGLKEMVNEIV